MENQSGRSSETLREKLGRAALSRWKLETATKAIGIMGLRRQQQMAEQNQEAENRAIRQKMWGNDGKPECEEDMGHMYLGDVTHQYMPSQQQPQKSGIGPLLAAGLGMLGPAGAIGGYFLNQMLEQKPAPAPAPQVQQIQNTENLGMRLLRESDLQSPFDVDK